MSAIKYRRKWNAILREQQNPDESSWSRLQVKEAIQYLKAKKLIRPLEGEI